MGFRSTFSSAKSLFQSGPGYRANLAQIGKPYGSFGGMDSASELPDGVADLADGELADGVATKHGTVVHGLRLPRTTRFTKKMQLSATLGYIHCAAKDVIACVPVWPTSYLPLPGARRAAALSSLPSPRKRGTRQLTRKKTPGDAGCPVPHGTRVSHAGTRITRTNLTTKHPNPTTHPVTRTRPRDGRNRDRLKTVARTAAGPESTAPRGRLRRGRPQRTRPCLQPLPGRLPAPAKLPVLY